MAENKKGSTQITSAVNVQVNVTDLTPNQKRQLFTDYYTQAGFSGFVKSKKGKQTYYTFNYKKVTDLTQS